jgi:cytochrome c-type biogenesis protein CcmH
MITFWIIAGLMLLAALALVLRPLLSNRPLSAALDQQDANIAVFRRRLDELETEQAAGLLTAADAAEARLELERQLLGDLGERAAPLRRRPSYGAALAVGLLLPIAAVLMYLQLGSPTAATGIAAGAASDEQSQVAFIREHIGDLEEKVRAEPGNLEAVLMLGRAYLVLQQYDAAVALYAEAQSQLGDQSVLLVDYAEALGYAQGANLVGRPSELLQRALAVEPTSQKALWLMGLASMQADQPQQAQHYWQRLAATLPPESETAEQVRQLLAEVAAQLPAGTAEGQSAAVAASLQVEVRLAPALAEQVPVGGTVFVLARPATGQRAPLAVVRQPVERLPLQVTLDESMAMVPGMSLREFPQVVVEARISRSGDAASKPGDLLGRSGPVAVAAGEPVVIVIDQVVE